MRRSLPLVLVAVIALAAHLGCKSKSKDKEPAKETNAAGETAAKDGTNKKDETATTPTKNQAPKTPPPAGDLPKDDGKHQGAHQWSHGLGGQTKDSGRAVAVGPAGETAVAGYFSTESKLGAETLKASEPSDKTEPDEVDGFVAVFDKSGAPTWTRPLGGKGEQIASSVAFDSSGNLIVVGWFGIELSLGEGRLTTAGADDIFIAKFAADGRRLWAKRFGGIDVDAADDVAVDSKGNIYVTGVFRAEADFAGTSIKSSGNADIYLLKLDPSGRVEFVKSYGDRYDDFGRSLAVDSQDNVVLFGEFSGKVSFGGDPIESRGNRDLFIAKLDGKGAHHWSVGMGTELDEMGLSVATDAAGNVVVTGSFEDKMSFGGDELTASGRGDVFVARYDHGGKHLWSKKFGGKDEDIGSAVATDNFGNIYITGWFWFGVDFGGGPLKSKGKKDAFVLKLDPNGSHLWSKSFGNKESDTGRSVALYPDGSSVLVGTYRYPIALGGQALPYAKKEGGLIPYGDIFLVKLGR